MFICQIHFVKLSRNVKGRVKQRRSQSTLRWILLTCFFKRTNLTVAFRFRHIMILTYCLLIYRFSLVPYLPYMIMFFGIRSLKCRDRPGCRYLPIVRHLQFKKLSLCELTSTIMVVLGDMTCSYLKLFRGEWCFVLLQTPFRTQNLYVFTVIEKWKISLWPSWSVTGNTCPSDKWRQHLWNPPWARLFLNCTCYTSAISETFIRLPDKIDCLAIFSWSWGLQWTLYPA